MDITAGNNISMDFLALHEFSATGHNIVSFE